MYRYGIIGFGGLGKTLLGNLIELENERGDFKLCSICGADPNSFKDSIKINLGTVDISHYDFSECTLYDNYKELIDKEKPDFVLLTIPTYLHDEVAVYALSHGVNVFSEKPMALNDEGCERMVKAAEENNKKLMVGQCLRFDPAYTKLKSYIEKKTFGEVYRAEFTRYSQTPMWTWNNWILDPEKSGGCILDMHIHDVDLINWYFGKPKKMISAMTEKKYKRESVFTQYYYDGLLVISSADWSMTQTFPFEARSIVNFEQATVVVSGGKITVYKDDEVYEPTLFKESAFMAEMRALVEWIIDDKPCTVTSPQSVRESIRMALSEAENAELIE